MYHVKTVIIKILKLLFVKAVYIFFCYPCWIKPRTNEYRK